MVALGKEHAGLFSNNEELAGWLIEAGNVTTLAANGAVQSQPRNSSSASSKMGRRGPTSISRVQGSRRPTVRSIEAGDQVLALGCSTVW
jgi:hypothetical protein